MCWAPSDCLATTPPSRSWPRARQSLGEYGPMSGTTDLSAGRRRRVRFTTPRTIVVVNTRHSIWKTSPASCKPTPIAALMRCLIRRGSWTVTPAFCWAHSRRLFFELADIAANARRGNNATVISPVALEAVKRIDALFDIERDISGLAADERWRIRQERSKPLLEQLESRLREQRDRLSRSSDVLKPINYMLKRWDGFALFVDDGKVCMSNNAAERALRGLALGRRSWLFAGSDRGAERAAVMNTLIMTARLNDIDPKAWLADVFARIADHPQTRLHELLPWVWKSQAGTPVAAQAA